MITAETKQTYWLWQGHNIHYVKVGESLNQSPALLLVHGFGASTDHWRKNMAGLGMDFEVWAIDLLGFGRSSKPNQEYSGQVWRDQLNDFITQVIKKPVILAGNSLGGYASLCVGAYYHESVAGIVLLNPAGPFSSSDPLKQSSPNPVIKTFRKIIRWVFLQPWANYFIFQYTRQKFVIRRTLEQVYLDKSAVTDQLVEDIYRPSCDPGAAQVFAAVFRTPRGDKVDHLLSKIKAPILAIWGSGDPWMNSETRSQKFKEYYPSLVEHKIEAGHCPHDECPDLVNDLIRNWVKEI